MKLVTQAAILAVVLGGSAAAYVRFADSVSEVPDDATETVSDATDVVVTKVTTAVDRREVRAVGTGMAVKSVMLHPVSAGRVTEVPFEGGQEIDAGTVVLRLDDAQQRVALRSAIIERDQLKRTIDRYDTLKDAGTVSSVVYEETRDQLQLAELRVEEAEIALEDRLVRAPFSGTIGITDLHPGDRVTTDTEIATFDDRSGILVDFRIPEQFAHHVAVGDEVAVSGWTLGDDDLDLTGRVAIIGSRIDPASRTLAVRARLPNPDRKLRPGASYAVRMDITGGHYPRVSEVSVMWSRDGSYVWRVNEDVAERVSVEIVRREKGVALVDGPLSEGDMIVVEGVQSVRPGQKLNIVRQQEGPAAGMADLPGEAT